MYILVHILYAERVLSTSGRQAQLFCWGYCFTALLLYGVLEMHLPPDDDLSQHSRPQTHTPFLPLPVEIDFCVLLLSALCMRMQQRAHHQHKLSSCAEIQSYISQTPCVTGSSNLLYAAQRIFSSLCARRLHRRSARGNEFERIKETLLLRECHNEITHQNALLMRAVEGYSRRASISTRFINFLVRRDTKLILANKINS